MAILSYKLGPGVLTLGAGPLDVSAQVQECAIEPEEKVDTQEAIDVLSGEQLPAEDNASYTFTLTATFLQDTLLAGGLVGYTWAQMGNTVAFKFTPNTVLARAVTGNLRVIPLKIGGTAKKRNTSDWKVAIIGTPVLGAA